MSDRRIGIMETSSVSHVHAATDLSRMIPAERKAHGKKLRDNVQRDAHKEWRAPTDRADPIGVLRAADATRQPDLVPLRYGRMLQSPFTFYRVGGIAELQVRSASCLRISRETDRAMLRDRRAP